MTKIRSAWLAAVFAAAVLLFGTAGARAQEGVKTGDPAPAFDVLEWVKDGPFDIASAKGKNVVLIDFFSVNWTVSKAHVEGRNKLQAKHAAAGLVVIGVATDTVDDVKGFLAENETKYPVCVDNMRNTVGTYGQSEPPLVVLVDKEGRIAWRGEGLDENVLERMLTGKFDVEKAKKTGELMNEMARQFRTGDPDKIEPAADAVLANDPNVANAIKVRQAMFAKRGDSKAWRAWIAKHVPKMTQFDALNGVAWDLATNGALDWREPATALAAATKAAELTQGKNAAIVDTLARVYYEVGLVDRAISTQKAAITAHGDDDEDQKKDLEKTLAYYEAAAAAAKTLKPEPTPKPAPPKKK